MKEGGGGCADFWNSSTIGGSPIDRYQVGGGPALSCRRPLVPSALFRKLSEEAALES